MSTLLQSNETTNGWNVHYIQTKKFKTISVVIKFRAALERETISKRALLPYILKQGTENYPTRKALQVKLDELYGASISFDGMKKGETHVLSARMQFANDKFIPKADSLVSDAFKLLEEMLFHPKQENAAFDADIFERERQTLIQKIKSVYDNKMSYANMRLLDEMCGDEKYSLHLQGYEEDLQAMTPQALYAYYKQMLKENKVDLYVIGDIDEEEAREHVEKLSLNMPNSSREDDLKTEAGSRRETTHEVIEKQEIQQAKLHMGYRTNITYQDELYEALQVYNGMLGGFPSSKLFINVREKNSLAYYAASRVESHKGLLFVFSGIAPKDYQKARTIIEEQFSALESGDFTDEEVKETIDLIINQYKETMDTPNGTIEMLYQQEIGKTNRTIDQLMERLQRVTREEILQVAGKVKQDTVYLLTEEGEQNE